MSEIVDRLLTVWTHPPEDRAVLEQELRAIYTDPLTLNGVTQPLSELVAFAVRTAGANRRRSPRPWSRTTARAATTTLSCPTMGAATEREPRVISSLAYATPVRRMSASARRRHSPALRRSRCCRCPSPRHGW